MRATRNMAASCSMEIQGMCDVPHVRRERRKAGPPDLTGAGRRVRRIFGGADEKSEPQLAQGISEAMKSFR